MSRSESASALEARRKAVAVVAAIGVASLFGCFEAAQVFVGMKNLDTPVMWTQAVFSTLPSWMILAALLAPTALLFRRFPLDRRSLHATLPVHLCAAALFTIAHLAATAFAAERLLDPIGYSRQLGSLATSYFTLDLLTYTAIVGVFQLVRVYRREVEREHAAAELSASLSHVRFHALRNQLDPHFIFNALNAINALAMRGDRDELVHTVGSLASLLRESLKESSPQLVPLDVELQYVSNYLALQTVRFPNRLRVETVVSTEAGRALVPALTLHALIEEAVAIRLRSTEHCSLILLGARRADALHVELVLEGVGHEDETALDAPIHALDVRLRGLYGSEYDLVRDRTTDRTFIRMRIPARHASKTAALLDQ